MDRPSRRLRERAKIFGIARQHDFAVARDEDDRGIDRVRAVRTAKQLAGAPPERFIDRNHDDAAQQPREKHLASSGVAPHLGNDHRVCA